MPEVLTLADIVSRIVPPEPWSEGDNIPWDDPAFSARMLREHLSQEHPKASRCFTKIDEQVAWVHTQLLGRRPARVLDLACGPGLYAMRLARLGHHCHGIDFGPASIAYAREQSAGLDCVYTLGDIRSTPYGGPYDLAMLIYGQFNVFRPREARGILLKAAEALRPGGLLLLEPHTVGCVRSMAHAASWSASTGGLFSDRPHLLLSEAFWDEEQQAATERFYVVDAASGLATRYAMTTLAYTEEEYAAVLADAGLVDIAFYPSLLGSPDPEQPGLLAITARRPMIPA